MGSATSAQVATYIYVGSWSVGDGPNWSGNPPVYSGQEAAALLFGGTADQYAISTLGTDPGLINFQAQVDGWGEESYLYNGGPTVSQSYKLDTGGSGYNSFQDIGGAYSAYVGDHSGPGELNTKNYAFSIAGAAPEPATWAMMILGFGMVGGAMRRRPQVRATIRFA